MLKKLAAAALASTIAISTSHAAQPGEGDFALFLSDTFAESNFAFDATGIPGGPSYNLGMFFSDDLMGYGSLRLINHEEGTNIGLGLGARFYQSSTGQLRTFLDGNFSYTMLELGGLDAVGGNVGAAGDTAEISIMSLGGFFGAEYLFTSNFSIAAKVGGTFTDYGKDADFSTLDAGVADVMFNFYF